MIQEMIAKNNRRGGQLEFLIYYNIKSRTEEFPKTEHHERWIRVTYYDIR